MEVKVMFVAFPGRRSYARKFVENENKELVKWLGTIQMRDLVIY
jgi:hypothetical protein